MDDQIEAIRLERPTGSVELARTGPSAWRLVKPDAYPADSAAVTCAVFGSDCAMSSPCT